MSNQSQPPRSRREIRMQRGGAGTGPESASGNVSEAPDAQAAAPVDGGGGVAGASDSSSMPASERQGERSSQTRAREREARRALKTLTAALPKIPAPEQEQVPTRRQLRRQQLQQENRAGTSVPADSRAGTPAPADGRARASGAPADAPYEPQRPPIEGGRRARRSGDTGRHPVQPPVEANEQALPEAGREAVEAGQMSVEQALAARDLLMGQAKNMVAMMESRQEQDPHNVDLELLAQQKALAERAAVLNRRAADKKRLSDENERRQTAAQRPMADIASAPMEFVAIPGTDQHVLRPSATSYIAVETTSAPAQPLPVQQPVAARPQPDPQAARTQAPPKTQAVPAQRAEKPAGRAVQAPASTPRSKILAQAEALAEGRNTDIRPLKASSAYGLDPLDARTAGLDRVRRTRLAVGAALVLGAAAFAAGIAMMVGLLGG